jgi:hypothetical protein
MTTYKNKRSGVGRPPKLPHEKLCYSGRAMLTPHIAGLLVLAQHKHGINTPTDGKIASDIIRLYVYRGLEQDKLLQNKTLLDENGNVVLQDGSAIQHNSEEDPTWENLRQAGLV